jgi:hypothetical protein
VGGPVVEMHDGSDSHGGEFKMGGLEVIGTGQKPSKWRVVESHPCRKGTNSRV